MRVLLTGIKSYTERLFGEWGRRDADKLLRFKPIMTKTEVLAESKFNGNTGNYFIGEGAYDSIKKGTPTFIEFSFLLSLARNAEQNEALTKEYDLLVFVTANLLRSDYDARYEAELFSLLRLPVVVMGIGCQRVSDLETGLPPGTLQMLETLASREHFIFTRGQQSADYLISMGMQNVWPTGCPSIYARPESMLESARSLKDVELNENTYLATSGYLGRDLAETTFFKNFTSCLRRPPLYVLQDEHLFHGYELYGDDGERIYSDMSGSILRGAAFAGSERHDLSLDARIFFNTHQWRASLSALDFVVGKRFHGTIAAMQAGIPSMMISVDDRMSEMIEQCSLPAIRKGELSDPISIISDMRTACKKFDFVRFSDVYTSQMRLFSQRLAQIGLQ